MEKLLSTIDQDFYSHDGILFEAWNFSDISESDLQEKMNNPQKYIPSYIPKTFKEMNNKPLAIFQVDKYEVSPRNMNLFTYEAIVKGNKKAHPALRSACIQNNEDYYALVVACEPHDEESELTSKNRQIIKDYVRTHEVELLEITGKECLEMEWYI